MNKKIKVYLQYPWRFPDSPYYKYLTDSPPKEIEYLNTKKQKGVITKKKFFRVSNFLKRQIRLWTKRLNLSIPNAHLSPKGNYDLIHCAHCLSKNKEIPWVADIEMIFSLMVSWNGSNKSKEQISKILSRNNCKKILSWTHQTSEEIKKNFPEIKDKLEVVYPAIPSKNIKKRKKKENITLIFTGRYFYDKGGLHALEAMDRLTKKYSNVYGIFNSEIPKEIKNKYLMNKKIKFYGLVPQKKLFELYEESDISIYPGYSDSFGFAYLESMSFGIPIITADGFARREIVEEGKTGFVIDLPKGFIKRKLYKKNEESMVKGLVERASKLIENKNLREKMSRECIKTIKEGKFSIKERNKKLKRIYEEAIK